MRPWAEEEPEAPPDAASRGPSHASTRMRSAASRNSSEDELERYASIDLWRGLYDVFPDETFIRRGGTQSAPMSTSRDPLVAIRYALDKSTTGQTTIFKLVPNTFFDRGIDLGFISAFPGEREYLYPPRTCVNRLCSVRPHLSLCPFHSHPRRRCAAPWLCFAGCFRQREGERGSPCVAKATMASGSLRLRPRCPSRPRGAVRRTGGPTRCS